MAAKIGHASRAYNTPEDLMNAIDEYISNPPTIKQSVGGKDVEIPSLTISGLCFELGFASRQSFYDYEKKEGFAYTIKRARLFIENAYEQKLHFNNCTGSIFALKSMGWKEQDHQETPTSYSIEIVNPYASN